MRANTSNIFAFKLVSDEVPKFSICIIDYFC